MVIFRKGRSSRKMELVATPPIGLPHQRPSDQGAIIARQHPAQHLDLECRAGPQTTWAACVVSLPIRGLAPPGWKPPPMSVLGRSARPLSPAQGPPSRGRPLLHSTQAETWLRAPPELRHLCSALADVGTRPAHPVLSSPPQMRSHAWSGSVPPCRAEPPPAPEGREGCQAPISPERTAPRPSPDPGPERGAEGARRARAAVPLW